MLELENDEAKKVFLVPWTGEVPIDLAGQFVLNGKVRRIGRETRLKQLFGTAEVEEGALHSALADHLLDQDLDRRFTVPTTTPNHNPNHNAESDFDPNHNAESDFDPHGEKGQIV